MTSSVELPDSIPVKLGNSVVKMDTDALLTSMTHQTIHKNSLLYNSDDFIMIFDVTKIELTKFLLKKIDKDFELFDFFDDWMEEFDNYQLSKNKLFCKDLIITFPDNLQFCVKFLDVLTLRNLMLGRDENDLMEDDPVLNDENLVIQWVEENLSWDDLSPYAEFVKTTRQENARVRNFSKAKKKIVEWDKKLSIFDFITKGDMIITQDEDED
jgi:hypothetical protein